MASVCRKTAQPDYLRLFPPVASGKLVEVVEDGRLIVLEWAGTGIRHVWAVIQLEEERGRPPTELEMAAGFVPGPIQPRTVDYYSEGMDDGHDRRKPRPVTAV
jgi:hypothetical protein